MNKEFKEILTGLLIDPFLKKVTNVKVENDLKDFYRHIGCSMVEVVSLTQYSDDDIWVDEEGLLKRDQRFFKVSDLPFGHHGVIAGRGLILGNGGEGNTISCDLSIEDVLPRISWDFTHNGKVYNSETGLFTSVEVVNSDKVSLNNPLDVSNALIDNIKSIHVID
jgi:hypothetical protein